MVLRMLVAVVLISVVMSGPPSALAQDPDRPSASSAPATAESGASSTYYVQLRESEERVLALKDGVFALKARMALLAERKLSYEASEAKAVVIHKNEMGGSFTLDQIAYYMDGKKKIFMRNIKGVLDSRRKIEIFSGTVVPGQHTIRVEMAYKGAGKMFTYLQGYKFRIKSKYSFYAARGKVVTIESVGYEKGGLTYSLEDRPAVKFVVTQDAYRKASDTMPLGEK
jgi:hypothetical protein